MIKCLEVAIVATIMMSCSQGEQRQMRLAETDERISLAIDTDMSLYTSALHHYTEPDGGEYITIENNNYTSHSGVIAFYNIDSCKLSHKIEIEKSGPNSISRLYGHGVISLDSIIVSSLTSRSLYLVNRKGEILNAYSYSTTENGRENSVSFFTSLIYNPLIIVQGKIYVTQSLPLSRWENSSVGNNFMFSNSPVAVAIDTALGECTTPSFYYPILFRKDNKIGKNEEYSRIYDGERFVYSFCCLDSLYTYDEQNGRTSFFCRSKYIGKIDNSGYKENTVDLDIFVESNTKARYGNIIYDKHNKVYYRFCHLADQKNDIPKEYMYCHGDFSIMIMDSQLNIIGETLFHAGKYAPMLFFVNKDGLWLSENNYERSDMTDDELVFRCLKLEEVK